MEQAQTATQGVSAAITKFSKQRGVAISNKLKPDCIVDMLQNVFLLSAPIYKLHIL